MLRKFDYIQKYLLIIFTYLLVSNITYGEDTTKLSIKKNLKQSFSIFVPNNNPYKIKLEKNSILINFAKKIKIDTQSLQALPNNISFLYGYDEILLKTNKDYKFRYTQLKNKIIIQNNKITSKNDKAQSNKIALQLTYINLLIAQGKNNQALQLSRKLYQKYPNNKQILNSLINTLFQVGLYQESLSYLKLAIKLNINHYQIDRFKRMMLENKRSYFLNKNLISNIENKTKKTSNASKYFESYIEFGSKLYHPDNNDNQWQNDIIYEKSIAEYIRIGIKLNQIWQKSTNLQNPYSGNNSDFKGNSYQGEIYIKQDLFSGNSYQISLFSGYRNLLGIGGFYQYWLPNGDVKFLGNINKPYWQLPASIVSGGTIDNLNISGNYIYQPGIAIQSLLSLNRYNLPKISNTTNSINFNASLAYTLAKNITLLNFIKPYGAFDIVYSINAQYITYQTKQINNETTYNPLPLFNFEIHNIELAWQKQISENIRDVRLYFGGSYNRYTNKLGMVFGGNMNYYFNNDIAIELFFSHELSTEIENSTSDIIGIKLFWYF